MIALIIISVVKFRIACRSMQNIRQFYLVIVILNVDVICSTLTIIYLL